MSREGSVIVPSQGMATSHGNNIEIWSKKLDEEKVRREKIRNNLGGRSSSRADRVHRPQESAPEVKQALSHPPQAQETIIAKAFDVLHDVEVPLSAPETTPRSPPPPPPQIETSTAPVATKAAEADRPVSRSNRRRESGESREALSSSRSPPRSRSRDGKKSTRLHGSRENGEASSSSISPPRSRSKGGKKLIPSSLNSEGIAATTNSSWKPNKPQQISSRHQHHNQSHSSSFAEGNNSALLTSPVPTLSQTPDLSAPIRSAPMPVTKGLVQNHNSSSSSLGRGGNSSGDLSLSQQRQEKLRRQSHSPSSRRRHSKPASPPSQARKHHPKARADSQRNRSSGSSVGHKIPKPQEQQKHQSPLLEGALSPEEIAEILEDIYHDDNSNTNENHKRQSRSKRRRSSGSSDRHHHNHHNVNGTNNKNGDGDTDEADEDILHSSADGDELDPRRLEKQHPRPSSLRASPGAPSSRRRASQEQIQSLLDESQISPVSRRRGRVGSKISPPHSLKQMPDLESTTLAPPLTPTFQGDREKKEDDKDKMLDDPPVGALLERQELAKTLRAAKDGKGATSAPTTTNTATTEKEPRTKESSPLRQSIATVSQRIHSIVKKPLAAPLAEHDDVEQPESNSDHDDGITKAASYQSRKSKTRSTVRLEDPELCLTAEHTTRREMLPRPEQNNSSQRVNSIRKSIQWIKDEQQNHPEWRCYLAAVTLVISSFIGAAGIVMIVVSRNCQCPE